MKSKFFPVKGLDGVYIAQSGKLSCTGLRLIDGSLCLYSPVAGLEKVLDAQTSELGPVSALFAPNHYHNKGLAAYVEAFPDANLYCSSAAAPRLSKITGLKFDPLQKLKASLPDGVTLHEPSGLKTGEVWMQINSATDCGLVVTDGFSSTRHPTDGYEATMLSTFPRYGVKEAGVYKTWVTDFLTKAVPTILLPCHGGQVSSSDLTTQLLKQLNELQ